MSVPATITVDGKTYTIPKIQVQEYLTLSEWSKKRKRDRLIQDMNDAGITPSERLATLRQFEDEAHIAKMMQEIYTAEGAIKVIETCCARGGVDMADLSMTPDEMVSLAAELCRFRLPAAQADETRPQAGEANPTTMNGTGG